MPNWIEGTMKLRGKYEDIRRFIDNELSPSTWYGREELPRVCYVDLEYDEDDWCQYSFKREPWIKDTRRAFITSDDIILYDEGDEPIVATFRIKQAWSFHSRREDLAKWKEICREYDLDLRLYGVECGTEHCEEIVITDKGENVKVEEITYDNWEWECPFPYMGG